MRDKELLELSAKAVGINELTWVEGSQLFYYDDEETGRECWQPLDNDKQAFRLAVQLDLPFRRAFNGTFETGNDKSGFPIWEYREPCPYAAARRAIVRAAANIGYYKP